MLSGFEVYKDYLTIKKHFNTDFDYFKYNGKSRVRRETFEKRKDRFFFDKLAKKLSKNDVVGFFVSNFVYNRKMWIGEFEDESFDIFTDWKRKIESLSYTYSQDVANLRSSIETWNELKGGDNLQLKFDQIFKPEQGQHPILLNFVFSKECSIETFVILNDILDFVPCWNKRIVEKVIWPDFAKVCVKYQPFVEYDKEKMMTILKKELDIL